MTRESWSRVRAEYEAGLLESPEARAARLTALREEGQGEVAAEVEGLWAADAAAGSFLESPPPAGPDPVVGTVVGAYRLSHRLGAGGMGAVYLATRADGEFRRRVAVKLLKPGMDSEEILRRFRFERQILAALDHPHIARLLDGGTTAEGRPYFVLEAVFGEPIDAYCHARPLPERLRLFAAVCRAVQFAHQNLVVHRDLKPSNILVTSDGVPKLLDFGIAKLLNPELGGPTLVPTALVAGPHTPDYASPEQRRGERVTTTTDVYSLGVLLAELATGERPRRDAAGEPVVAPPPGDLGAIVAKALRPVPTDRYSSAASLAEDVERFLEGHPVHARRGSTGYRARLFLRRQKVGVGIAITALVAILGFGIAMAILAARLAQERERAEQQRIAAEEERSRADLASQFLAGLFQAANPFRDERGVANPTAKEMLQLGAARARELEDPALQARLLRTIGVVMMELGQTEEAESALADAVSVARAHFSADDLRLGAALNNLAMLYDRTGKLREAESMYQESLEIRRKALGEDHLEIASTLNNLGVLYLSDGRYDLAVTALESSIRIRRVNATGPKLEIAGGLGNLSAALVELRRLPEAERHLGEAIGIVQDLGEGDTLWDAQLKANLAAVRLLSSDCRGAREPLEGALVTVRREASESIHFAKMLQNLGRVETCLGNYPRAFALLEEGIALVRRTMGPDHPAVADNLQNQAETALAAGDLRRAERQAREAIALRRRALPRDHPDQFDGLAVLADVLAKRGDRRARALYEEVVAGRTASLGADHPKCREAREALARWVAPAVLVSSSPDATHGGGRRR